MNDRVLKIALIVSLLVNAFLAAAAAAGGFYLAGVIGERSGFRQHTPLAMVAHELDPAVQAQLKQSMRGVALSAAPDFSEARAARKRALELAGAPAFDAAAVQAELAKARAAEDRGRARLENGFIDFLKTQPQPTRTKLAKVLSARASLRLGPHGPGGFGGPRGPEGPPPDHEGPPPPPPER